VVVASQLRRPPQMMDYKTQTVVYGKPSMNDLKGCGKIEEEAAFVLLLYDSGNSLDPTCPIVVGDMVKNRFGPTAVSNLAFYKHITTFKSLTEEVYNA